MASDPRKPSADSGTLLIPTRLKVPIGKSDSYPVGAEIISAQLKGVAQFGVLSLGFTPFYGTTSNLPWKEPGVEPVMEARYRNLRPGISGSREHIDSGFYDETWELNIYPVRRHVKEVVSSEGK